MLWELGVKWLGREADHSDSSSADVVDRWSCTFLHTFLYGMYRDSFTFMLLLVFCYVVPCDYAVLSTIITEHHIYLKVRWSCTLDDPPFTVSIFQEVIQNMFNFVHDFNVTPPVWGWWKGKWFLLYIYITTGHHWCTGPGMLNILKFWYSPLWRPSGSQFSQ